MNEDGEIIKDGLPTLQCSMGAASQMIKTDTIALRTSSEHEPANAVWRSGLDEITA